MGDTAWRLRVDRVSADSCAGFARSFVSPLALKRFALYGGNSGCGWAGSGHYSFCRVSAPLVSYPGC